MEFVFTRSKRIYTRLVLQQHKRLLERISLSEYHDKFILKGGMLVERSIEVWAYNLETVLAEKLETIISRNVTNTRMRDFYDIHILQEIHGVTLPQRYLMRLNTVPRWKNSGRRIKRILAMPQIYHG